MEGTLCNLKIEYHDLLILFFINISFSAQSDSMSYGAGEFSGVFFGWYLQEWMSFKNGTREKFLKYFYDPIEGEYRPECEGLTAWKWTRHFLASKLNNGEWMIEGEVPEPVGNSKIFFHNFSQIFM